MNDMTTVPVIPATDKIAAALAKAAGVIENPPKNREVTVKSDKGMYKFKYATFDAIIDAIRKPLSDNGLWFVQTLDGSQMVTTLYHSSGQTLSSRIPFATSGSGPQATGSALSYAKRYGLCALMGIAADEDDDGNIAEGNHIEKAAPKQAAPKAEPKAEPKADKPDVSARATAAADKMIAGMTGSLGDASRLMSENGLIDIDGDDWTLEPKSALSGLKSLAPTEFERIRAAYTALQNKDIAA